MTSEARAMVRSLNVFVFCALSFLVIFAWDVAYGRTCDAFACDRVERFPPWVGMFLLFGAPMLLCAGFGSLTGQWRPQKSLAARLVAAVWCIAAPVLAIVPFFTFMCLVFRSCFGD